MLKRILTGWNFLRVVYVILGSFVIVQSVSSNQWAGIIFGAYFASMGLFAFGCAAGNCFGGSCAIDPDQSSKKESLQDSK